jgi:hypothetical protein
MKVFAAVLRIRKEAETPVAMVNAPNDVMFVLTAIVTIPEAVLITVQVNAVSVGIPPVAVSNAVPVGSVIV